MIFVYFNWRRIFSCGVFFHKCYSLYSVYKLWARI